MYVLAYAVSHPHNFLRPAHSNMSDGYYNAWFFVIATFITVKILEP